MSHIALLLPTLEVGGAERVMLLLAREFAAHGHRVDLVLLHASGPLLSSVPEGVRLVDLAARKRGIGQLGFSISSVRRLAAWLKRERPDALLSTITGANLVAVLARKISGIPMRLVIRVAGSVKFVSSSLRLLAMRWLYPQADAVIALNPVMAEDLVEIGVAPSLIHYIANPLDIAFIQEQAMAPLEHPWLDDQQRRVVISVGRLTPEKDYVTLLHAVALLRSKNSTCLVIVGEGPERERLEQVITDLKMEDRVKLAGLDPNPWRWMARANLFVLSSCSEGHPNALREAMVLGLPVVVTEYDSSVYDFFTETPEYPRRVVTVGDPKMMADAIMEMIDTAPPEIACYRSEKSQNTVSDYEELLFLRVGEAL